MVTFVGFINTTRLSSTLTRELTARMVMIDCEPFKASPLMLMPPTPLSACAVMVPKASTGPLEVATLPWNPMVAGFTTVTSKLPVPVVRAKPPAVTRSRAASSSRLALCWAAAVVARKTARHPVIRVRCILSLLRSSAPVQGRQLRGSRPPRQGLVRQLHDNVHLGETAEVMTVHGGSDVGCVCHQASDSIG